MSVGIFFFAPVFVQNWHKNGTADLCLLQAKNFEFSIVNSQPPLEPRFSKPVLITVRADSGLAELLLSAAAA